MKTETKENEITRELLEFMKQKGVIGRLQEEQQMERELGRAVLFTEMSQLNKLAVEEVPPALDGLRKANENKAAAEAALLTAKHKVMAAEKALADASHYSYRAEMKKGSLAKLADPRIHTAIILFNTYFEAARRKNVPVFSEGEKNFYGKMVRRHYAQPEKHISAVNRIRQAISTMQQLLCQPRPADIQEIINSHINEVDAVCRQAGMITPRHPGALD